jgi:8-oxo-dGTP pyrophosphatase MutT (NUDIX family)
MFKAAVLIPICQINNETYIIFEKRAKNIKQGDEICFPGGKYEENDLDFSHTALRETSEELGISANKVSILKELDTFVTPFNSLIYSFLAYIDISNFNELKFEKNEVQDLVFIPFTWFLNNEAQKYKIYLESHPHTFDKFGNQIKTFPAKDYGLPEKYHSSWSNGFREIYLYNYQGDIIWGFTASILKDFLEKFKKL